MYTIPKMALVTKSSCLEGNGRRHDAISRATEKLKTGWNKLEDVIFCGNQGQ